ncbi:MAG: HAD family phosphatase [Selenomonadaceae bacterium]|nr:HAD family phosphatase [Selenomonadaceae bacterium]
MAVKLFVTDLDGTLLPTGRAVSAANVQAVQDAVDHGVIVTIATGRMYQAALPIAQSLGVDVPIITYNGALIKSAQGEVFYTSFLPEEYILEVLDFCRLREWHIQLYSDDVLYYAEANRHSQRYEDAQKVKGQAVGWDGLRKHTEQVTKLLLVGDSLEETDERIGILRSEFGQKVAVMRSNPHYTEIVNHGVSKASGIERLADELGIDIRDTMAIGDSDNDLPMLKAAGCSVAMGNALPHVKDACDYVTGECEADGFAEAVRRYVLQDV